MPAGKGDVRASSRLQRAGPPRRKPLNEERLAEILETMRSPAPSWADFAAGGDSRRRWLLHWLRDMPLDGLQWLAFHVLSVLPITFVSAFGGRFARLVAPRLFPDAVLRAVTNLRWLEPTWSETKVREVALRHFEGIGRLRAEFCVLHRLIPGGRVSIENGALARRTMRDGPVILVGMHIANWEVLGPVLAEFGIPVFDVYEPQPSRMQTRLALTVRARTGPEGSVAYARSGNAARAAVKWLREGGTLIMFCDEAVNGLSAAPFFGRPPHLESNYAFAARLARMSSATLLPFHVLRHRGCRFTLRFGEPIRLGPTDGPGDQVLADVALLNGIVEPIVRAHLDQWFWLDWSFATVNYRG
jgi:KDO2-lipid IV(A) lauroyltransferase